MENSDKETEAEGVTSPETGSETPAAPEDARIEEAEIVEAAPEEDMAQSPAEDPAPTTAEPAPQKRSGGLLGGVIGGLLAAAIGYGAAQYIKPEGWPFPGTGTTGSEMNASADKLAALEAQVASLANTPAPEAAPDLSGDLAALGARLDALEARVEDLIVTGGNDEAAAALAAYEQEITAMREELAAQQARNAELAASVSTTSDEAEALIEEARKTAEAQKARAAMLRIAAALDSGESFDDALTDLGNTEIPEALSGVAQDGAPSLADLRSTFPSAARAALAESLRETAETEPAGRFTAFLRSQLGARSLAPREGDDPDAVLSRAEAAVDSGDLDQAIGELATLPQAGQDAMADWVAAASARIEALAAARSLYESLNSN